MYQNLYQICLMSFLSIHLLFFIYLFFIFVNSDTLPPPPLSSPIQQTEAERRIWCETAGLNIFLFF